MKLYLLALFIISFNFITEVTFAQVENGETVIINGKGDANRYNGRKNPKTRRSSAAVEHYLVLNPSNFLRGAFDVGYQLSFDTDLRIDLSAGYLSKNYTSSSMLNRILDNGPLRINSGYLMNFGLLFDMNSFYFDEMYYGVFTSFRAYNGDPNYKQSFMLGLQSSSRYFFSDKWFVQIDAIVGLERYFTQEDYIDFVREFAYFINLDLKFGYRIR